MNEAAHETPDAFLYTPRLAELYSVQILAPDGIAPHRVRFVNEIGGFSAVYTSEHGDQMVKNLVLDGDRVTWEAMMGSHGDELFMADITIFNGGILLGYVKRIDIPNGPKSPLVCRELDYTKK